MRFTATVALALLAGALNPAAAAEPMTKSEVIKQANTDCRVGGERVRHWARLGWRAAKKRRRSLAVSRYERSLAHRDRVYRKLAALDEPRPERAVWGKFLRNTRKLNLEHHERLRQYRDGAHRNVFRFFSLSALNYQRLAMAAASDYGLGRSCERLLKK
jgi:hypothetical protein